MADDPEPSRAGAGLKRNPPPSPGARPTYDAIALRAYFIALHRHARGQPGDPLKDWVEAERQLLLAAIEPRPE